MPTALEPILTDPFLTKIQKEREAGFAYQKRRHEMWDENYTLYRDTVQINRLTQRQSVNIPLMKETIKTLLAEMDEAPDVVFEELDNDLEKEYVLNEYWSWNMDELNFEGMDMQDKKNVLLYGRSFMKLNFFDNKFDAEVLDIYDILVDPKTNPLNIESAKYLIHQNIFRSLKEILADEKYDEKAKEKLKEHFLFGEGLVIGDKNREALEVKKERMALMGSEDFADIDKLLAGGDTVISLSEYYTTEFEDDKFIRYVAVLAEDNIVLYKEPLEKALGVDFWPFTTWAEDLEVSDIWSDGEADVVRTINKVLNAWFSQTIENRSYRNFGMRFFDATKGAFNPKSWTPEPWGFYPVPGNPNDILKEIEIPGLSDNLVEMEFLVRLAEKATATPAVEKGVMEKKQATFGEIGTILAQAKERVKGTAKFYKRARKEFAQKWYAIIEANSEESETITLFKKSHKGRNFAKKVKASDWKSKAGYKIKVSSSSEQDTETATNFQKLMLVGQKFPDNAALQRVVQKRMIELADLTPDEIKEIMDFEKNKPPMQMTPMPNNKQLLNLKETVGRALVT